MNYRILRLYGAIAALMLPGLVSAQSNAELLHQLSQTKEQIAAAEAAGADPDLIAQLKSSMNDVENSLRADNAAQQVNSSPADASPPLNAAGYPTRPNTLVGGAACADFSLSNYRELALSGGNDIQLKTMCGQAFEYYSMYLRAIEQGYSESDANRTYSAFEGAASNASSFYRNNRSN